VYVTHLTNINIDNNVVDAIGIFKSELQSDFLQFEEKGTHLEMILQQGVNLSKLDKGCIIFNYKKKKDTKSLLLIVIVMMHAIG